MSLNPEARHPSLIDQEPHVFQSKWLSFESAITPFDTSARLITAAPGTGYDIEKEKHKVLHSSFQAIISTSLPDFAMRPSDNYAIFMRKEGGRPHIIKARDSADGTLDDFLFISLEEGTHLPPIEFGKPWKLNNPGGLSIESNPVQSILVREEPPLNLGFCTDDFINEAIPFDKYARLLGALMEASKTNK